MKKIFCGALTKDNEKQIQLIRNTVFTSEQNVDPSIDFDGQDIVAIHTLIFVDNTPVATGRMLGDGHIGRVAVLKTHRGLGLGSQVIAALQQYAIENQYPRIYLGSQLHAEPFYTKLGFKPFGAQYTEANIEHISMEKVILP
ncbi:GNAT family N-acetyltransferase [Vibrio sp. VB16]|uniref:GNAT family N-acetyltransferase n=1 Tax=Vibrio sp. VB16 TaxID=2785746 RepID=UPI00189D76A9|nr:GNAT family N-acetyltransferase [Vibrio sp. VB16]UGA56230.1 GNAT family N-acetyltransferase [Vibrio sp. VB16]